MNDPKEFRDVPPMDICNTDYNRLWDQKSWWDKKGRYNSITIWIGNKISSSKSKKTVSLEQK